jgi:GNAT superfamily N-acetyltransferase
MAGGKRVMNIHIKQATAADLPRILELYKDLNAGDLPVDTDVALSTWKRAANSGVTYFVAKYNGQIAATCYISIIPNITRQCSSIGFIENVVTAEKYRRLGIGRKLLETAIEYAKSQGCYKVTLQSGNKRTETHKFYESVGFDGDSKRAYEIRF